MRGFESDALRDYLSQIGENRLLTPPEEKVLCGRIERQRQRLRRAMLSNGYVLRRAIRLLQQVRDGELRLDRTLEVSVLETQKRDHLRRLLAPNIRTARQLLRNNRRDFALAASPRRSLILRREAWRRLTARRNRIVRLVEETLLRTSFLQSIFKDLQGIVRRAGGSRARRRLAMATMETPKTMHRRLAHIGRLARDYENARGELAVANLRLVVATAKRYCNRGVSLTDLIQEGNGGLMRAVDKFQTARGCRFSTCAVWWIRQAMLSAITRRGRMVRVPSHIWPKIEHVQRIAGRLAQEYSHPATVEQTAEAAELSEVETARLLGLRPVPLSIHQSIDGDEDSQLGDILSDGHNHDPSPRLCHEELQTRIEESLRDLTERERKVIHLRFGLAGESACSLAKVGRHFGVSRERARQIETVALRKLQHPTRRRRLRSFLDQIQEEERDSTSIFDRTELVGA